MSKELAEVIAQIMRANNYTAWVDQIDELTSAYHVGVVRGGDGFMIDQNTTTGEIDGYLI